MVESMCQRGFLSKGLANACEYLEDLVEKTMYAKPLEMTA